MELGWNWDGIWISSSCLTKVLGISPRTWSWTICSSLQGAGGSLCLSLEVDQGWDGLPVPWESPAFLISQLPGTHSSPAGVFGEAELCWGGAEGVRVSQGKNQRAQISAQGGIPIFVPPVLSLGHLSPNKGG